MRAGGLRWLPGQVSRRDQIHTAGEDLQMRGIRKATNLAALWMSFAPLLPPAYGASPDSTAYSAASDAAVAAIKMISCGHSNVWKGPENAVARPRLETQLEKGEPVTVHELRDGWALVEAQEQQEFTHKGKWEGYPGWVRLSDLCAGAGGVRYALGGLLPRGDLVLSTAEKFLGAPYLWGGIPDSTEDRRFAAGIDCSGLVFYSYRAHGRLVPRDAHEQWMAARPISADELHPGDLIFSAKKEAPGKVTHVMLYIAGDTIIEAKAGPEINKTRTITAAERFGVPLKDLRPGTIAGESILYFGTFRAQR